MRLYFARHGESEANVQQVFWNGLEGYGLTAKGRQQAEALAERLAGEGVDFAALYCSPVLRAVQTTRIIAARLGLPYETADGLREYDVGNLEGEGYNEENQQLYWEVTTAWLERGEWDVRIEKGESYRDIKDRFMPFVRGLERDHAKTDANVLLIGHGGTFRAMLPLLLANIDNAFAMEHHFGYTTCVIAELVGSRWTCLRWGNLVPS
jgi:broad specificity phosphatase PhoE